MLESSMSSVDLDRLLRLRVIVARVGEMDLAQWWNTKGQLGALGAAALRRSFPRTHRFAAARSVFAIAAHRCKQLFDPPGCVTLWRLPEVVEDEFDARWEHWLDHHDDWHEFFARVAALADPDLLGALDAFDLVGPSDLDRLKRLKRSAEGKAVPLPSLFDGGNDDVTLLAVGFARGEVGAPAVPYMRWDS
jgi:hypothetical protein